MLYDDNTQDIKLRLVMIVSFKWSFELASINLKENYDENRPFVMIRTKNKSNFNKSE